MLNSMMFMIVPRTSSVYLSFDINILWYNYFTKFVKKSILNNNFKNINLSDRYLINTDNVYKDIYKY